MTTTTGQLMALTVSALLNRTDAGGNVFGPGDWPTWAGEFPVIRVQGIAEDKESLGRATIEFTVTSTIRITAQVTAAAQAHDGGASAAEDELWSLARQIETTIINAPSIMPLLQHYPFVRSRVGMSAEGRQHVGELVMDVGMEFYQGPEDFYQPQQFSLQELQLTADLTNVADLAGTYPNPPFSGAIQPAPRTSGPDGRAEGSLDIHFP